MTSAGLSFGGTGVEGDVTLVEPNSLNLGSVDWQALEMKFNELNALRSAPRSGLNASKARQKQKEQVSQAIESLLEMAQAACRRMLVEGDAKEAIEGGLKTLKLKEAYYNTGSLQLVPSYFHLARVNQYMDRYKAAEEFLSLAQWAILKHPHCDTSLKAELHQTYGLLYASDGRLDIALKQLAQATYYLTELHGPEHVLTSFGYFDLGNVFAAKANMDCAMSFYDKVKDIWYTHLTECFQCQPFDINPKPASLLSPEQLGEENLQDALKMLRGIVGLQTERFTQVHPCTGKAELVLGLFNVWIADNTIAQEGLGRALEIHKRVYGPQHQTVAAIKSYMTQFKYPVPEFTSHYLDGGDPTEGGGPEGAADGNDHHTDAEPPTDTAPSTQAAIEGPAGGATGPSDAGEGQPPQQQQVEDTEGIPAISAAPAGGEEAPPPEGDGKAPAEGDGGAPQPDEVGGAAEGSSSEQPRTEDAGPPEAVAAEGEDGAPEEQAGAEPADPAGADSPSAAGEGGEGAAEVVAEAAEGGAAVPPEEEKGVDVEGGGGDGGGGGGEVEGGEGGGGDAPADAGAGEEPAEAAEGQPSAEG